MSGYVGSAACGSRAASRVRVRTALRLANGHIVARPSRYSGQVGTVVRVADSGSVLVRLPGGMVLPFGSCELDVIK